ncbi:MAG: hypothetical protein ACJ74Y_09410, partial [Bryobacteraceae bacterium]
GLAAKQSTGGAAVFHDVVNGNNSVPGVPGFTAGGGYDLVTGLGSVDASQLISHWSEGTQTSTLTLSSAQTSMVLTPGQVAQVKISSAVAGGFNSAVALSITGAPAGLTAAFSATKLAAPGSGDFAITLTAAKALGYGTYTLTITGQGGSLSSNVAIAVTVQSAGTFALSAASTYLSVEQNSTGTLNVLVSATGGFNAPVAISIPGLPAGVVAAASLTPSGNGTVGIPLPIVASKSSPIGIYGLLVTATGGGQTRTVPVQLTITIAKSCALASNPAGITIQAGGSMNFQVTCGAVQGGFNSALNLSMADNKPDGIAIQQLNTQVVPGSTPAGFAITSAKTAAPGSYTIQITGKTTSGFSSSVVIPLTVTAPNSILVTSSASTVTLTQSGTATLQITTRHSGTLAGPVSLWMAGLPAGVTARLSASQFAAPGDGTATVTLIASSNAPVGTKYSFVASAMSGDTLGTIPVNLVINAKK